MPRIRRREPRVEPLPGLHPVVARVMAARGITDAAELDPSLAGLLPPGLVDLEPAVERLASALAAGERILVVGDFDADGATSTALAVRVLRAFGHAHVDYLVPNRFEYGYGLTPELVELAATREPGLIVTVDNGVSSHEGVTAAAARGIDTLVTDHHLPGTDLPAAVAVVNPNRADCDFPSKALAGVGVVFYLLVALRAHLDADGWFARQGRAAPSLAEFLDLVALGTVADLVPLDRNNRILVEQGLRRIRAGRACAGIRALLQAAKREPARTCSGDLGFAVAPRLNAAGRLADMALGIETLLAETPDAAALAADRLDALNRERRDIEAEMREQADAELERLRAALDTEALPAGVALHDARWHQGVIGILAGRVREAIHRPTIIFADAGGGYLKGSARSIPGLHMRDVLAHVDTRHPELITRFGGHAMAAGLTLPVEHLESFREAYQESVHEMLDGSTPTREIFTDGALDAASINLETAEALRAAGPWGAGFPEPAFDGTFRVNEFRTVGEHHLKLSVTPEAGRGRFDAIAFRADAALRRDPGERVQLVYRLDVNEYRGRRSVQLVVEHIERLDNAG